MFDCMLIVSRESEFCNLGSIVIIYIDLNQLFYLNGLGLSGLKGARSIISFNLIIKLASESPPSNFFLTLQTNFQDKIMTLFAYKLEKIKFVLL